ncbi:monocarboxylate transporter 6 isoform D [Alligator mississippiensis]|uniref:Monocarboxylate transporter 6 isoform D n=1 Tax=Alligator mississippiensis TaxID=8496 RepID=A0A151N2S8_ALLMI|nr:monocarboxylate transporter 6 isoform D [Alligator mississippiensis]
MTKLPPAGPNNIPCDFCSSGKLKPIKTCLQHTPSLCETHTQLHYKDKVYRSHQLLEPISDLKARLCLKHHKLQKQNCRAEGSFLGHTRLQEGRRNHEAVPLQGERATKAVENEQVQVNMENQIIMMASDGHRHKERVIYLMRVVKNARDEVNQTFAEIIKELKIMQVKVLEFLDKEEKAALVQMGNSIQQNQVKLADLWKQSLWMTGLLENTSDQQFVQEFPKLKQLGACPERVVSLKCEESSSFIGVKQMLSDLKAQLAVVALHFVNKILKTDYCNLNFDPNTTSEELLLFKETHSVLNIGIMLESSSMPCQGFNHWPQVLCTQSLCGGCHYWEVEVSDSWLCLGATYSYAHRTGKNYIYLIGRNSTSWCLEWDSLKFSVWHNNIQTVVKGSYYQTVGIFLDYAAGSLTFYGVTNTMNLIYHFLTTFTEPLYPAAMAAPQEEQRGGRRRGGSGVAPHGGARVNRSAWQKVKADMSGGGAVHGTSKAQDRGWAWMVLLATVLVQGLTLGFPSCVGVFFTDLQHEFQATNSETSWFPSIMTALLHAGGPLCSVLVERFGCRLTVMLGGLLSGVGMVTSSFSKSISQLYITAGFITGLGSCFSFQAGVTVLGYYFVRRRALANAVASTGVSIGLTLWPLISQYLLDEMGWRNTFLIFGGVQLNCCVCGAIMRPVQHKSPSPRQVPEETTEGAQLSNGAGPHPAEPPQQGRFATCCRILQKYLAFDVFYKNKGYQIYTIGVTWMVMGFVLPLIYLVPYATQNGVEERKAALLISIIGFINIFMRPMAGLLSGLNIFAGRRIYLFSLAVLLNGLSNLICVISADFTVLVLYCLIYSVSMSGIGALVFQVLMDVVEMDRFSSALGLFTILESITILIGPPLIGLLVDLTGQFSYVFYASSFFMVSAALFMGLSFCALEKKNKLKEAPKVTGDSPSKYQYTEVPSKPEAEGQAPPAVMYITSI